MKQQPIAIIGAGPYGLSVAAHLTAAGIENRIFGRPMLFWAQIANAGGERYLKSYCFGTNLSTPTLGYSFGEYSRPRGLEVFEPCAISDFAEYGKWFQERNVSWVEPVDAVLVRAIGDGFEIALEDGRALTAQGIVIATGLTGFAHVPMALNSLSAPLVVHSGNIRNFGLYKGQDIAVVGAGQSALEAAALLAEAGARPQLLIRGEAIRWQTRVFQKRNLWRRLRSPLSGLGTGPKAWALTQLPGAMHYVPATLRVPFVQRHLPPEGAWWLRKRVENVVPVHCRMALVGTRAKESRVSLDLVQDGKHRELVVDRVIAGTGYHLDLDCLKFLEPGLRARVKRLNYAPKLNSRFESSVPGLYFVGPGSAMCFGPLFRFVVGASYTAKTLAAQLRHKSGLAA